MSDDPPPFRLGRIGQIAQHVRDIDASVAFYRDALGLPLLFMAAPSLAFLDCGGTRLMLSAEAAATDTATAGAQNGNDAHRPSTTFLYFSVADILAARDTLRTRGVLFVDEPHVVARTGDIEVWMTFFNDPDGHPLALMCERLAPA